MGYDLLACRARAGALDTADVTAGKRTGCFEYDVGDVGHWFSLESAQHAAGN